uniref:Uncharacterized protein n=1 Tax=Anguilla anguilla TaxID=7936 RepID=A0A0E9TJY8_ANGAN
MGCVCVKSTDSTQKLNEKWPLRPEAISQSWVETGLLHVIQYLYQYIGPPALCR